MQRNRINHRNPVLEVDFSAESTRREETKRAFLREAGRRSAPSIEKEITIMNPNNKKRFKRSTTAVFATCLALVFSVSAFAAVNSFKLGEYINYMSIPDDMTKAMLTEPLPEDSEIVVREESEHAAAKEPTTLFEHKHEAQEYLAFEAMDFGYVPEGYQLEGWRIYNEENGLPQKNTKYLGMYFYNSDNNYIYVQARLMDEETAYTFSNNDSRGFKKLTINGHEAIAGSSFTTILFEGDNDVSYSINARNLPQSETIKMAESLS